RAPVASDGTYTTNDDTGAATVEPGTYTIVVLAMNQSAPPITNKVLKDGDTLKQDFTLATAAPFPLVKSPAPIPLTDGIESASFQDAPEIVVNGGQNVVIGDPNGAVPWNPSVVSGRFRLKYSAVAIHVAADATFQTPLVNSQTGDAIWNGNAFEFDFQNDPYDGTRTTMD